MSKVISDGGRIVHCISGCDDCNWTCEPEIGSNWVGKTRAKARAHTNATGHTTWVETASATYYRLGG